MGRQVKCKDTGEKIDIELAYKVVRPIMTNMGETTKNEYWSSKDAFDNWSKEDSYRKQCIDFMFDLFNYNTETDKINSSYYKFLTEYKNMGYEVLYETLKGVRTKLEWAIDHKQFSSDYHQMKYLMAIVANNVMTYKKKINTQNVQTKLEAAVDIHQERNISSVGRSTEKKRVNNLMGEI